jgi:hypothetical protein
MEKPGGFASGLVERITVGKILQSSFVLITVDPFVQILRIWAPVITKAIFVFWVVKWAGLTPY